MYPPMPMAAPLQQQQYVPTASGPHRPPGDLLPPTGSKLYIGRVPPSATSIDLTTMFEVYGHVLKIDMKPQGYAFIHFEEPDVADEVVAKTNGTQSLQGVDLLIEVSRPRTSRHDAGGSCFVCFSSDHWYAFPLLPFFSLSFCASFSGPLGDVI